MTFFAIGALSLAALIGTQGGGEGESTRGDPLVLVERRALEVTLVEPGTLAPARSVTLGSSIRSNRAKIVSILADGTWVRPGVEIVRFDATPFEEEAEKAKGELREAEAAASRVRQERKLQVAKAEEALESARHRFQVTKLALETYEQGSGALNVREAEVRAAERSSELDRARAELRDLEAMFRKGFVSEGELARQRGKVEELARRSSLEGDRLTAAKDVVFPRDLERARGDVREAEDAVARAEAVVYHTHEFYEAAQQSAARQVEQARRKVRITDQELEKIAIEAPLEGFLILQDIPLDSGRRKPQVGDSVWSGQPIATIPDLSQMVVHSRLREIDLHRIEVGASARVDVEAFPDVHLGGRVDYVGSLAEAQEDSPWKFFSVRLLLDRTDPRLRPGMSVRVSFELDRVSDALVVPIDAVFANGDRSVVYVRRGTSVWEERVELGLRNETHVAIRGRVDEGERLLLRKPGSVVRRRESAPDAAA